MIEKGRKNYTLNQKYLAQRITYWNRKLYSDMKIIDNKLNELKKELNEIKKEHQNMELYNNER